MNEEELEAHRLRMQALMRETIAPLLERLDAAEESLRLERLNTEAQDKGYRDEARERFRASLVVQLISGQLAANTFDWFQREGMVEECAAVVDLVLTGAKP